MRVVLQRVDRAAVEDGESVKGAIGPGVLMLVAVAPGDTDADASVLAAKIAHLRIFPDGTGKMERSLLDAGGAALIVSQFTLYGDARRGRRPSWAGAAPAADAAPLIESLGSELRALGIPVATGSFGADMRIDSVNNGPVTILLETAEGRMI